MTLSFPGRTGGAAPWGGLDQAFQAHSTRVAGLCRHMLRDQELARDATNDVFLRVGDNLAGYDGSIPLERWLLRIAANHCIDLLRRRKLERRWMAAEGPEAAVGQASPLTVLLLKERRAAVEHALDGLEDAYRIPLVLRYYAELTYDEISAELAIEKTQVAGRIFRAKQMLRAELKEKP